MPSILDFKTVLPRYFANTTIQALVTQMTVLFHVWHIPSPVSVIIRSSISARRRSAEKIFKMTDAYPAQKASYCTLMPWVRRGERGRRVRSERLTEIQLKYHLGHAYPWTCNDVSTHPYYNRDELLIPT